MRGVFWEKDHIETNTDATSWLRMRREMIRLSLPSKMLEVGWHSAEGTGHGVRGPVLILALAPAATGLETILALSELQFLCWKIRVRTR